MPMPKNDPDIPRVLAGINPERNPYTRIQTNTTMPIATVTVPADLWDNIKLFVADTVNNTSPRSLREMLEEANGIDTPKPDEESENRRARIIEIAEGIPWVRQGEVEIASDACISEGSANGCYVSGWVWCDFTDTELDKRSATDVAHTEQLTEEDPGNED